MQLPEGHPSTHESSGSPAPVWQEQVRECIATDDLPKALHILTTHLRGNINDNAAFTQLGELLISHPDLLSTHPITTPLLGAAKIASMQGKEASHDSSLARPLFFAATYLAPEHDLGGCLEVGKELLMQKKYALAEMILLRASANTQSTRNFHLQLGTAQFQNKNYNEAIDTLRQAIISLTPIATGWDRETSQDAIEARHLLGRAYLRSNQMTKAIDEFLIIVNNLSPQHLEANRLLGLTLPSLLVGESLTIDQINIIIRDAVNALTHGMQMRNSDDPLDLSDLYCILNCVHHLITVTYPDEPLVKQHLIRYAVDEISAIFSKSPDYALELESNPAFQSFKESAQENLFMWGMQRLQAQEYSLALTFIERSLLIDKNDLLALTVAASSCMYTDQPDKAVEYTNRILQLMPKPPANILYFATLCAILRGDLEEANRLNTLLENDILGFQDSEWPTQIPKIFKALQTDAIDTTLLDQCREVLEFPNCPVIALRAGCLLLSLYFSETGAPEKSESFKELATRSHIYADEIQIAIKKLVL